MTIRLFAALTCLWLAASPARAADLLPIFDAHLHYNAEAQEPYPLPTVLELFRKNGVRGILASSRPNDGSWKLFERPGLPGAPPRRDAAGRRRRRLRRHQLS